MNNTALTVTPITDTMGATIAPAVSGSTILPDPGLVIQRFKQDGVLLFSGFPLDKDSFIRFC
jgi:hypothetical protein